MNKKKSIRIAYKEISYGSLKGAYKRQIDCVLNNKTDDTCVIFKFARYYWYVWSKDLPIVRSNV